MDLCMKETLSNIDNVTDPPHVLIIRKCSWFHQGKRNEIIFDMDPSGCDLEPKETIEIDKNIKKSEIAESPSCEATTNVVLPLTTKKVKKRCMMMAGWGVIATSDQIILDAYQELIYIDSNLTMTERIASIHRKHVNWWTISWKNNFRMTKIQNKSLCTDVIKCIIKMVEWLYDSHRKFDKWNPIRNINVHSKDVLWNCLVIITIPWLQIKC